MSDNMSIDPFDRTMGLLDGLTGVSRTKPSTITETTTLVGNSSTFVVQTFRQRDEHDPGAPSKDTIFLVYVDAAGSRRIVIPPKVADAIARQRDSLATKSRIRAGKAAAATRKGDGRPNPLLDPAVRARASATRRLNADAKRRRRARKAAK